MLSIENGIKWIRSHYLPCNGAVAAVKKGCQLYKDIKGAAGM
jgi:hypothetical protein